MSTKKQDGRPVDARKMLSVLRATKSRQDVTAQPNRGRGLWLSTKLWLALTKHLEQQAAEVDALQQALLDKDQEAAQLRQQIEAERLERRREVEELQARAVQLRAQAEYPLAELGTLRTQMRHRQDSWDKQKYDLETQMDRMMGVLRKMGLLADSDGQRVASAPMPPGVYGSSEVGAGLSAPEAQALQVRELSMLLADARHQAESYRRQLAMRSVPAEEMALDMKRLKVDNQRLVALLAKVPEYRALAAEVAAESGVHYIPMEECLMIRGLVDQLHPPLLDRPVDEVAGAELAGAGRRRDPDDGEPSLTLVLDEQYHWVPRKALETGAALMRRMMPALPTSQLLVLVAELNKIWRDRERQRLEVVAAAHSKELRQLQYTFQQRAPYEAVVAGQKVNDLKRRMRAQAAQSAAAAATARADQRRTDDDSKVMLHAGLSSITDLSRQVTRLLARNKKLAGKAARQQRALTAQQPICSACLDRMLLPNTLGPPRTGALNLQQQERLDAAAAAAAVQQPYDHQTDTAAAAGTRHPEGPYGNMGAYSDAPSTRSASAANGYDEYGRQMAGDAELGPPQARLRPEVPTFNLLSRSMPGQTDTEPYNAGAVVRVNLVPPRPPLPLPASPSAGRARENAASSGMNTSSRTAAGAGGTAGPSFGGEPGALAMLHLGPDFAAAPGSGASPAHGGPETSAPGIVATFERSTASLADWGTGTSAPITVQVQVVASSPPRTLVAHGGTQGSDLGGGVSTTIGGGGSAWQMQQPRGVPVRVRVRFPRQDLALVQQTQQ